MFASSVPGQKGRTFAATLGMLGIGLVVALPAGIAAILSLTAARRGDGWRSFSGRRSASLPCGSRPR